MKGLEVEHWALFISILSALFTGLGWILSVKRHNQDLSRERGSIIRGYEDRIERINDSLRKAVVSGNIDDYTQMALSIELLRDAISLNIGWGAIPVKTSYGAYRRFVQNEDFVGIGLLSWRNRGHQEQLEVLGGAFISALSSHLQLDSVIQRIREGMPPPKL